MQNTSTFPRELPLGRHLGIISRLYFGALTKRLEKLDIERHYSILILLENSESNCNQKYISELLNIDKASMVRMIDYLCDKGCIKRFLSPTDRREYHIRLTEKGRKMLPRILRAIGDLNQAVMKGLNKKQKKDLYTILDTLRNNVMKEPHDKMIVNFKKVKQR